MFDDPVVVYLAWALAAIVLGWTWLPALISGLGGSRFQVTLQDTAHFELDSRDPQFMAWYVKIRNLGYEPLGQGSMRVNYAAAKWRWETPLVVFSSRKDKGYLILQQQLPARVWTPAIFATCWSNGGLLLTNSALTAELDDGEYATQGFETDDLNALAALHLEQVGRQQTKGYRIDGELTLDTLVAALVKHTGPAARYQYVKQGQTFLTVRVVVHAFMSFPIIYILGWTHLGVPLTNLGMGLLLAYSDLMLGRKQVREWRERYGVEPPTT